MGTPSSPALLSLEIERHQRTSVPLHHVFANPIPAWSSYFSGWGLSRTDSRVKKSVSRGFSQTSSRNNSPGGETQLSEKDNRIGFKNPWPSWVKPNQKQIWDNLQWGEDDDPCIKLATSHLTNTSETKTAQSGTSAISRQSALGQEDRTRSQQASQLLQVTQPDFTFDSSSQQAKTTWLGHAGMLVQLPPLEEGGRPIRCIFDPIFSNRASPSQAAGPIRSYPPPCKIESLPPIDIYMLSHNHYDHLDYATVMSLWKFNRDWIRFVVPLGNKEWFVECGIDADRVTELDWWDAVRLSRPGSKPLKITCTPNQHNSGRSTFDADTTLWSSWYVEHPSPKPYKVFFAGDTGFQFHSSPDWPPAPPSDKEKPKKKKKQPTEDDQYPSCPAFEEIAERLGAPHLLLLPVAVGATFSFLKSYVPLPDSISPFPRHSPGLTAANHMPSWDAVRVFRLMTSKADSEDERPPVAIAMHWGTFVPDRTEILKTLGSLEWACDQHDVQFARSLSSLTDERTRPVFLAVNHGQSVST